MVKKIGLCPGQQLSTSITKIYQTCYNTSDNHYHNVFRQIGALVHLPFSCSENAYESDPISFVAVHT